MRREKKFKLNAEDIEELIPPMGGCIASDKITVDGQQVVVMYRGEPHNEMDSGWQFYAGTETQEYLDDATNSEIYDVNTIANFDRSIIPYLNLPTGTELEREPGTDRFNIVSG